MFFDASGVRLRSVPFGESPTCAYLHNCPAARPDCGPIRASYPGMSGDSPRERKK